MFGDSWYIFNFEELFIFYMFSYHSLLSRWVQDLNLSGFALSKGYCKCFVLLLHG